MGFLEQAAGELLKQAFSDKGTQMSLLQMVLGLITNSESGGMQGLVDTFNEKGLGDVVSSWIGKGVNMPISPEQIGRVFDGNQVRQIAERLGVSSDEASKSLADLLPMLMDQLTPEGSVPEQTALPTDIGAIAQALFGKRP